MAEPKNKDMDNFRIARFIRQERERRGWSRNELGQRLKESQGWPISERHLTRLEKSQTEIRVSMLLAMVRVFGIEAHDLAATLAHITASESKR